MKQHDFWRSIGVGVSGHLSGFAGSINSRNIHVKTQLHFGDEKTGRPDDAEIWLVSVCSLQPLRLNQRTPLVNDEDVCLML